MGDRTGVWLVGARGSVATTAIAGAAALRQQLLPPTGCVTELPAFSSARLPGLGELVFGGHDIVDTPLARRAEQLAGGGVIPPWLAGLIRRDLEAVDAEIRPGVDPGMLRQGPTLERLVGDLVGFRERHGLARVVVIDVSSTEPPIDPAPWHAAPDTLDQAVRDGAGALPPSSLYALAAFIAGCPFVEFTPSTGMRIAGLEQLATARGLPYAGCDGKTGETMLKSVLGPMFAARALRVRSWTGTNILGGGDGANLADAGAARSKIASKQRALADALGYPVDGAVHIDYVPDMGDWKTAWDHVSFEGFLGVRMTLQFIWQGCDSALAAPLVLDLARLVGRANEAGAAGPLAELAFFFKDPVGAAPPGMGAQFELLADWVAGLGQGERATGTSGATAGMGSGASGATAGMASGVASADGAAPPDEHDSTAALAEAIAVAGAARDGER